MTITDLQKKSSPLYEMFESTKDYALGTTGRQKFIEAVSRASVDLERLISEYSEILDDAGIIRETRVELLELMDEIRRNLLILQEKINTYQSFREIEETISVLAGLDSEFLSLRETAFPQFCKVMSEDELLEFIGSGLNEEMLLTKNYLEVEDAAYAFLDGDMSEEQFVEKIAEMKALIHTIQDEYENLYICGDEWAIESSLGDKLLKKGMDRWNKALDSLLEGALDNRQEDVEFGLDLAYSANEKLALLKLLYQHIRSKISSGELDGRAKQLL